MLSVMIRLTVGLGLCIGATAMGQCDRWLPGLGDPGSSHTANSVCEWDPALPASTEGTPPPVA